MDHVINYVDTFPVFLAYFAVAITLMALFLIIYVRVTPYHEFALIKQGNPAPAITLSGSLIGFILPLCSVIKASVSLLDLAIWGAIALLVQIIAFLVINRIFPSVTLHVLKGETSSAILFAAITLGVGMINAACMSY